MNGYTYDLTDEQKRANLTELVSGYQLMQAAAKSEGDPNMLDRWLAGYAQGNCNDNDTGATLSAMEARVNIISETLGSAHDLTAEEATSLLDEQAELINRINRAQDDCADDYADMRREAGFGRGLSWKKSKP